MKFIIKLYFVDSNGSRMIVLHSFDSPLHADSKYDLTQFFTAKISTNIEFESKLDLTFSL